MLEKYVEQMFWTKLILKHKQFFFLSSCTSKNSTTKTQEQHQVFKYIKSISKCIRIRNHLSHNIKIWNFKLNGNSLVITRSFWNSSRKIQKKIINYTNVITKTKDKTTNKRCTLVQYLQQSVLQLVSIELNSFSKGAWIYTSTNYNS